MLCSYDVELGGVGVSSKPSYCPANDPFLPNQPIFATQTAIFRLASLPARSPRSVRSSQLPFMPGSKESSHAHQVAGKFSHPISRPGNGKKLPFQEVHRRVKHCLEAWNVGDVSLAELWGNSKVCGSCAGSRRYLVGCLGGWGDCQALCDGGGLKVYRQKEGGLKVRWEGFTPSSLEEKTALWDTQPAGASAVPPAPESGGW